MISPNFKVREFSIADSTPYAISLSWSATQGGDHMETESVDGVKETSGDKGNVVFTKHNVLPSAKMLTFMRNQTFEVTASYADPADLAPGTNPFIGMFTISNIPVLPNGGASKIKVKVRLDLDGLISVDSAQAHEEIEVEEEDAAKKEEAKKEDQAMPDAAFNFFADAPAQPEPASVPPESEQPATKKKKIRKHDLTLTASKLSKLSSETLEKFKSIEFEMAAQDRHIKELQEKKNDLEAYIYSMRDRVNGDLSDYILDSDKTTFSKLMDDMENWLYSDEAETANKSMFVSKLDELRKYGGPAEERFREAEERPSAIGELEAAINEYAAFAVSTDAMYEHISAEDREKVQAEVKQAREWLVAKQGEQAAKRKTDPVAMTAREVRSKRDSLQYACRPIMNKPKPAPAKIPEAKQDDKPSAQGAPDDKSGAPKEPTPPSASMDEGLD
jgi:heat shock protein 4